MDETINVNFSDEKPIIKVIGVGGGGGNAVNYMYKQGIKNVDFVICNTDAQALKKSPIVNKIQLGEKGLGAGNKPEKGREEAESTIEKIEEMLNDSTEMVFITAGMGGGTGTGAAPIIAKTAKEMGILTIGIVTIPFLFEGTNRVNQAIEGVIELRKYVDAIIIMNNERIKALYGDLALSKAFANADNVLTIAAKGIAEIITAPGIVNVDLNDVRTVMTDSGDAIMGAATAVGPDRASEAILKALDSPLLLSNDIRGTKNILLNISYGISEYEVTMDEISIITSQLEKQVGLGTQIIWGATVDEKLEDKLSVTVVATGFSLDKSSIVSKNNVANVASQPIAHAVEVPQQAPKEPININEYYGQINTANSNYKQPGYSNPQESMQQEKVVVTLDLNDDNNVDRLEAIPAYKRKNMQNIVPENDSKNLRNEISDFSIGKNGDDFCIKEQNDFLHNNVD